MKKVFCVSILMLLKVCYATSQPVIGMGAGYTTAKSPLVNLQLGFQAGNSIIYYNQLIHTTRKVNVPHILGVRYGYSLGSFQPNAGIEYHMLSSDKYKVHKPDEGFRFALGVTKYFKNIPFKADAGITGKYVVASISIYKILD